MSTKPWCIAVLALAFAAPLSAQEEAAEDTAVEAMAQDTAMMEDATAPASEYPIPPGLYRFVPEESEEIDEKMKEAVNHMFFAIRGIARRRLAGANEPIDRIFIDYQADTLVVSLRQDEPVVKTLMTGEYIPYTRADGEVVQVKADVEPGLIDMYFKSDDGEKQMIYQFTEEGKLELESISYSEKLEEPFRYTWVYERPGG
ncbi:MAG: hypothetical protein R3314_04790 [Longimicrobiales bacterium]|nr:hypothetical protein [Longimicrobiales bacterium]